MATLMTSSRKPLPTREVARRVGTQALVTLLALFWLVPVAMMVTVGKRAFGNACWRSTKVSGRPFARAVVM